MNVERIIRDGEPASPPARSGARRHAAGYRNSLNSLRRNLGAATDRGRAARKHLGAWMEARAALRAVESVWGRTEPVLIRTADEYARDRLGWIGYAPWLRVYAAVAGEFREGWLPDNYYATVVAPRVNGAYIRISRLRAATRLVFRSQAFPDLLFLANGLILAGDGRPVSPAEALFSLKSASDLLVFKPDGSGWGTGIRLIEPARLDAATLASLGNGAIQSWVRQHPFFDAFQLPSVATIRILTAVGDDGRPAVRGAYLRLGRGAHTHVVAQDQVRVAVDPVSGSLHRRGFRADWRPIACHPDTRRPFEGVIPRFGDCMRTVLDLHMAIPQARAVAWDVVVDEDEKIRVLEWEGAVVSFAEATQGPCFGGLGWDRLHEAPCGGQEPGT